MAPFGPLISETGKTSNSGHEAAALVTALTAQTSPGVTLAMEIPGNVP